MIKKITIIILLAISTFFVQFSYSSANNNSKKSTPTSSAQSPKPTETVNNQALLRAFDAFLKYHNINNSNLSDFFNTENLDNDSADKKINNVPGVGISRRDDKFIVKSKSEGFSQDAVKMLNSLREKRSNPDTTTFKKNCIEELKNAGIQIDSLMKADKFWRDSSDTAPPSEDPSKGKKNPKGYSGESSEKKSTSSSSIRWYTCLCFLSGMLIGMGIIGTWWYNKNKKSKNMLTEPKLPEVNETKALATDNEELKSLYSKLENENRDLKNKNRDLESKIAYLEGRENQKPDTNNTPTNTSIIIYAYLSGFENLMPKPQKDSETLFQIEVDSNNPEKGELKLVAGLDAKTEAELISFYGRYESIWSYINTPDVNRHRKIRVIKPGQVYKDTTGYWKISNNQKMQIEFV